MTAGELCIRRVITADPEESVVDAARRMTQENVGDLVVVKRAGDRAYPIGIVTDRDLVMGVLARGTPDALEQRVGDIMQTELVTAYADEHVTRVLERLDGKKIRRIPIVDRDGVLQGILTLDDLLEWIGEQFGRATSVIAHQATVVAAPM